jgi:hypothetical protein
MEKRIQDDQPAADDVVAELLEPFTDTSDAVAAGELAEAERAVARNGATPGQERGVAATRDVRRVEDRVAAWRAATDEAGAPREDRPAT